MQREGHVVRLADDHLVDEQLSQRTGLIDAPFDQGLGAGGQLRRRLGGGPLGWVLLALAEPVSTIANEPRAALESRKSRRFMSGFLSRRDAAERRWGEAIVYWDGGGSGAVYGVRGRV